MSAGGLNYWDDTSDNSGLFAQGSYSDCKTALGRGFNRVSLSQYCKNILSSAYVDVVYSMDIIGLTHVNSPRRITSVTASMITRDSTGRIVWVDLASDITYTCDIFIDASTDGRIARTENSACTTGRYDWPTNYLSGCEAVASDYVGRQQAATLMVKMRLPSMETAPEGGWSTTKIARYDTTPTSKVATIYTKPDRYIVSNGLIFNFNVSHMCMDHIMIKPVNAARDGINSNEFWVNGILVFNVDGRAHYRDIAADTIFKVTPKHGYRTTDDAWVQTKEFIKNHLTEIQNAFGTYEGFSGCEIVLDAQDEPVVGDLLYIRESVHMAISSPLRAHNSESNYQITKDEVKTPGSALNPGSDQDNYATRIGVAKYACDLHPFRPCDLISPNGDFVWGEAAYHNIRVDACSPTNPVYIPYEAIKTGYSCSGLLPTGRIRTTATMIFISS